MPWYVYPLLVAGGALAGFVNILAGSGSAITLPLLILAGLPAVVANGTNRVAILLESLAGLAGYRRSGVLDTRGGAMLAVPAVLGSLVGARVALHLDELAMRRVIGAFLLLVLVLVLWQPQRWLHGQRMALTRWPNAGQWAIFFAVGVYGGLIQAGVGIFLLAGLVLSVGYDVVRGNAVKTLIVLCFTVAALAVFALNGQVNWRLGLVLALGNVIGAWAGARFAISHGAGWVRRLLVVVIALAAAQLLGVFAWMARML